jgi:photosystem II stability/assembly factor-like uncharacterized protein
MKKILFTLFFLHFSLIITNAQWVQQQSGFNNFIRKIKFVDRYTGWVCGDNGYIAKTTNAGQNWLLQQSGIYGKILSAIHAVDQNVVYCVGYFETILKTTNGGINWIAVSNYPIGQGNSNEGVFFINPNTGWILSALGRVLKTTDACQTFDTIQTGGGYLRDVYFKDLSTGLICGEVAQMFKSTNGGLNWNFIYVPVGTQSADFENLTFINNQFGWVVGSGNSKVYRTTNFGDTWDSLTRIQDMELSRSIYFSSLYTGWIAGQHIIVSGGFPRVFKTTNGGFSWNLEDLGTSSYGHLTTSWFYNDSVGWVAGAQGMILYTTTGGQPSGITKLGNSIPDKFLLKQNYPNPFNFETIIGFSLPRYSHFTIRLYNSIGQLIEILLDENRKADNYEIRYNASKLSSGIYFYTLITEGINISKKFILLK